MKKNFAFTLAEILITLGIIGVVAAITLGVFQSKIQKFVLQKQFLKFYSNLQNAYELAEQENGGRFECYQDPTNQGPVGSYRNECGLFWDTVLKKLKVIKVCNNRTCLPNYKNDEEVLASGGKKFNPNCPHIWDAAFQAHGKSYFLNDGSMLHMIDNSLEIGIDINGKKGPNKWGYDVFYIRNQLKNNKIIITDSVCGGMIEPGGMRIKDYLQNHKEWDGNNKNTW